ncbi:hypothetical protein KJ641_04165, partial [Patescibacteria group bacterium]|nr:hypothetical protein [Patescibacteria group bacterium]
MLCLIVLGISATIIFSSDSSKKSEVGNEKNCEEIQLLRERIDNLFTTQNATLSSLYINNLNVAFHNLLIWIRDNRANYQADNFVSMLVVLANDIRSQVVDLERRQKARLQAEQAEARAKAEAEARAKAEAEATRLQDISDLKEEATKLKQQLVGATMVYLSVVALNNNEDTTKAHDELVELRKELEIVSMRMVSLGVSPEEVSINTRDFAQGVSPTDKKIVVPPVPKDQDSDLVEPDVEY